MTTKATAASGLGANQSASGVVIHQYRLAVRGSLIRRYKRFLADVIMTPPTRSGSAGGPNGSGCVGISVEAQRKPGDGNGDSGSSGDGGAARAAEAEGSDAPGGYGDVREGGGSAAASAADAVTCHCPNTGPMIGLLDWPMAPVVCSVSLAPGRKYKHTLEMIQSAPGGAWVGIHSALANRLVGLLLEQRLLPQLGEWREVQREVPYGSRGSRVDFVLTRPTGRRMFVEVKSVTLAEPYSLAATAGSSPSMAAAVAAVPRRIALFPDTVSDRAQRHVEDLMVVVRQGHEAACVFVIQRDDCALFAPCVSKDPKYAKLVRQAAAAGVQMLALRMSLQPPATGTAAADAADTHPEQLHPYGATAAATDASAAVAVAVAEAAAAAATAPDAGAAAAAESRGREKGGAAPAARRRKAAVREELDHGDCGDDDEGAGGAGACGAPASIVYLGQAELDLEYGDCTDDGVADATTTATGAAATAAKKRGCVKRAGGAALRASSGKKAKSGAAAGAAVGGAAAVEGPGVMTEVKGASRAGDLPYSGGEAAVAADGPQTVGGVGRGPMPQGPAERSGPARSAGRRTRARG